MKRTLLSLFITIAFYCTHAQETKKVLFIGNSYTYYSSMPGTMVKGLASSGGDVLIFDTHTPGGSKFQDHAANATVQTKLASDEWDYVVLQEQSQRPSWGPYWTSRQVEPYATQLCDSIRSKNPCSIPLFFMTWGYKNGDASNCANLPWVCTYEGMDNAIYDTYLKMAKDNKANLAPVGKVWRYMRDNSDIYPWFNPYNADESHPTKTGSFLAAVTIYTLLYEKDPTLVSYNAGLPVRDSDSIKHVVKRLVYEHLSDWKFEEPNPLCSPTTGTNETEAERSLNVYPNPANEIVFIESNSKITEVSILNSTGQLVEKYIKDDKLISINTSELPSGIYSLIIISSDKRTIKKIVVE